MFESKIQQLLYSAQNSFAQENFLASQDYLIELIDLDNSKPEYFSALATAQKKLNLLDEAKSNYFEALKLNPSFWEAYYNLGLIFQESGLIDEAIQFYQKAIGLNSQLYLAFYNLGNAYKNMNNFDLAIQNYSSAVKIKNNYADAFYNMGVVYEQQYNFSEALRNYNMAIKSEPNHVYAHWNLSLLLLLNGDFQNGFQEYEWRLLREESVKRNFLKPRLINQDIHNKKIYVYSEQGLGDAIQFVRMLPLLKNMGCYLIFEADPQLIGLFSHLSFIDLLIPRKNLNEPNIDYDYHIPLLSLPFLLKSDFYSIPAYKSYLHPDSKKVRFWQERILSNKIKVGIVWAGNRYHQGDKKRSIPLKDFKVLSQVKEIELFSLQKGESSYELSQIDFPVSGIFSEELNDFSDTAAAIENLDLVITVDTSAAHLAGAMGKAAWLLLPYFPDWRWQLNRSDSLWYPSMKLFRQPKPDDWSLVFREVVSELIQFVKQKKELN